MSNIKVLIVEDEPMIAADIYMILDGIDYEVAGVAHDSDTAIKFLQERHPDIVLLDISIEGEKDGIELAHIINSKYHIPFIYLTSYSDKETLDRAKTTLPYGYIVKPFKEKDLFSSIEVAIYRHANNSQKSMPSLLAINQSMVNDLTEKEYEVLGLICEGMTNRQIAERLFISINTVKTHIKSILLKLDVPNRSSAIALVKK
jgi:DNA-binding NarL/FixJ family response regulator